MVMINHLMKQLARILILVPVLMLFACVNQQALLPLNTTATAENDPCSSQKLPATVQGVNDLMQDFDKISGQIAGAAAEQVPGLISELQRIRRNAEDLQIPSCLATLKIHQLNHMNLTIQQRDLYSLEMIRLLGITLAPVTVTPAPSQELPAVAGTP
jgi:hypothetical protein